MISYKLLKNKLKKSKILIKNEVIKSLNCLNRVSATNILSKVNNPAADNAAFDGFAIKSKDTNNLGKKKYPPMLITSSIFDNRVLYSEPVKYIAKLRDVKEDENEQLLKCKMEAAGHGGMSGRDNAIKELAEEYSFILKNAKV